MGKSHKFQLYLAILLVIATFLASLYIRQDALMGRPGASFIYQEEVPLHVMSTLWAYAQTPWREHLFLPIWTGAGVNDRYYLWGLDPGMAATIYNPQTKHVFYSSFPALGFVAPYAFMQLFQLPITLESLRIFNLTLNAAVYLSLFTLCYRLSNRPFLSFAAATVYLLNANALWNGANVYWHHNLLLPLWVGALNLWVSWYKKPSSALIAGLGILMWLMALTEYTSAFVLLSFLLVCYWLYRKTGKKIHLQLGAILLCAGAAGWGMILLHFLTQTSLHAYIDRLVERAAARSLMATEHRPIEYLKMVINEYRFSLLPYVLAIGLGIWGAIKKPNSRYYFFLFLAAFPMLENLVLLEHAAVYTFAITKVCVLMSLCVLGIMSTSTRLRAVSMASVAVGAVIAVSQYHFLHPHALLHHPRVNGLLQAGALIREHSPQTEPVFTTYWVPAYYSGRLPNHAENLAQAREYLNHFSAQSAKLYFVGDDDVFEQRRKMPYINRIFGLSTPAGWIAFSKRQAIVEITLIPQEWQGQSAVFSSRALLDYVHPGEQVRNQLGDIFTIQSINGTQVTFAAGQAERFLQSTQLSLVTKQNSR